MNYTLSSKRVLKSLNLNNLLAPYARLFSKSCYQTFKAFIKAIISLAKLTYTDTAELLGKSIQSIVYFINHNKVTAEQINQARVSILKNRKETRFRLTDQICLDFTALVKTGKLFEFIGDVWDQAEDRVLKGYDCLMASIFTKEGIKYPLDFDLLTNKMDQYRSKFAFVKEFLKKLFTLHPGFLVVMDSGFKNQYLLPFIMKEGRHFLIRATKSMVFWQGKKKRYLKNISKGSKHKITVEIDGAETTIYWATGIINAWQRTIKEELTILSIHRNGYKPMYLITSQEVTAENAAEVYCQYLERWSIEELFKELKGFFSMENFRVKKLNGIKKFIALVLVAYTVMLRKLQSIAAHPKITNFLLFWLKKTRNITGILIGGLTKIYQTMLNLPQFLKKIRTLLKSFLSLKKANNLKTCAKKL